MTKFIYEDVCCRYGFPLELLSDRGEGFKNEPMDYLCAKLKIKHNHTTPYYAQWKKYHKRFHQGHMKEKVLFGHGAYAHYNSLCCLKCWEATRNMGMPWRAHCWVQDIERLKANTNYCKKIGWDPCFKANHKKLRLIPKVQSKVTSSLTWEQAVVIDSNELA